MPDQGVSPPKWSLEKTKLISDIAAVWVGLIALLVGAAFALVQYLDKEKGDRVKVTLDFLDRLDRPPVADARKNVLDAWRKHEEDFPKRVRGASAEEFNRYVLDTIRDEKLYADIALMLNFYETLQICIANKLCDASISHALFKEDARAFFRLHYPYIEAQKDLRKDPKFGSYLRALATSK